MSDTTPAITMTPATTPSEAPPVQPTPVTPPVEVAPPATPEVKPVVEDKKAELASSRFAALARKEAKLHEEREKLKAERDGLTPLQEQIKQFEEAKKNAKMNPLKALTELGLTLEEVNDFFLNGEQPTQDAKLSEVDRKIEEFRKEQQAEKERIAQIEKDKLQAEHNKVLEDYQNGVFEYIASEAEQFELINLYQQQVEVLNVISQHYDNTGEVMSKETAADLVEKYLVELVEKAMSTKKVKAKAQPQPQAEQKQVPPKSTSNTRTISSTLTPTSQPMARPMSASASSDAERLAAAVAKYHELARH